MRLETPLQNAEMVRLIQLPSCQLLYVMSEYILLPGLTKASISQMSWHEVRPKKRENRTVSAWILLQIYLVSCYILGKLLYT